MDFIILYVFRMLFNFIFPENINKTSSQNSKEPSTEAAFWYGTSFENLHERKNNFESSFKSNESPESEYDNTW